MNNMNGLILPSHHISFTFLYNQTTSFFIITSNSANIPSSFGSAKSSFGQKIKQM